jgi:hypothetical protein
MAPICPCSFFILTVCPLSILPAAIVGRKRPGIAGAWLMACGFVSPLLLLPVSPRSGYRRCPPRFFAGFEFAVGYDPLMLPVRGRRGYKVYAAGMEASAADKAKILKFVKPGVIADLGCGSVLERLRRKFAPLSIEPGRS